MATNMFSRSSLDSLSLLAPQPSPFPLLRLGGTQDGAYLLPSCLEGIQFCFSPGVDLSIRFENDLLARYGIKSFMCDPSPEALSVLPFLATGHQFFLPKSLHQYTSAETISLPDWVESCVSASAKDLILQMDIEGAEYSVLASLPDEFLNRFRVIVIELHDIYRLHSSSEVFANALRRLTAQHTVIHIAANNSSFSFDVSGSYTFADTVEVTLLSNEFMHPSDCVHAPVSPHPLDVSLNIPLAKPIYLTDYVTYFSEHSLGAKYLQAKANRDYFIYGRNHVVHGLKYLCYSALKILSKSLHF